MERNITTMKDFDSKWKSLKGKKFDSNDTDILAGEFDIAPEGFVGLAGAEGEIAFLDRDFLHGVPLNPNL